MNRGLASAAARPVVLAVAVPIVAALWLTLLDVPFVGGGICGLAVGPADNFRVDIATWPPAARECTVFRADGATVQATDVPWVGWLSVALTLGSVVAATAAWRGRSLRAALIAGGLILASLVAMFW